MPQVPTGSLHYLDLNIPFVPSVDSVSLPPAAPPPRNALLLPHLVTITSRLQQGFSAQRIYQDLIEDGTYYGSYDSIKRYARKLKKKVPHFYERLSVFPGREGQVDFSFGPLIGSGTNKKQSWLFKMTLSFSRHAYEELVYSQNVETFLRCHERAFAFFGGVPETILNSVYLAFSNWYGFIICPVNLEAEEVMQLQKVKAIGPPGTGKTHIAVALGLLAIENGFTVLYRSAFDLVEELQDAFRTDVRKKYVQNLIRPQLLIVDELGMKTMPQNASDDFLEIIHRRYGSGATLIATNRPVEDWGEILEDTAATSAILDRFLDGAQIVPFKGKSYRLNRPK